jgi:hypothetical protein
MTEPKPMQPSKMSSLLKGVIPAVGENSTPAKPLSEVVPLPEAGKVVFADLPNDEVVPRLHEVSQATIDAKDLEEFNRKYGEPGSAKRLDQIRFTRELVGNGNKRAIELLPLLEASQSNEGSAIKSQAESLPTEDANERANEKYRRGDLGY